MVRIGQEVTDEVEITSAAMVINCTGRPKYAAPQAEDGSLQITIAPQWASLSPIFVNWSEYPFIT